MSAILLRTEDDTGIEIPHGVSNSLRSFRRWTLSPEFPQSCRIDFVAGQIEVDMSPEELFTHNSPKIEILRVLANRLLVHNTGIVFGDRMRIASASADLSAEPDVAYVSRNRLKSGRVRMAPAKDGGADSCLELVGAVDLVVEIVCRSSLKKDTQRLLKAYFDAGVEEYWIVNALGEEFRFQVYGRGRTGFKPRRSNASGMVKSSVFDCDLKMVRTRSEDGYLQFRLEMSLPAE
jgi:Uma2 family endonuclease